MPYSDANDPKLPSNVKKLSEKRRRQWIHVWNSEFSKHGDEGRAFASANSVAGRKSLMSYDDDDNIVEDRRVSKDIAGYEDVGSDTGEICSNCQWFLAPNACLLVAGEISPNGYSDFYFPIQGEVKEKEDAVLPSCENQPKSAIKSVIDGIVSLFKPDIIVSEFEFGGSDSGMQFMRTKEGGLRWFALVSNNFKDREQETITEAAHREFVSWADHNLKYPELWLWHGGSKSKWGTTDCLDVSDGFLVATGMVDKEKEYIAQNLSGEKLGVSHGFLSTKSVDGVITKYRTFEISPLPLWAAANEWTAFSFGNSGSDVITETIGVIMPFSKEKKQWYKDKAGLSDQQIGALESSAGELAQTLKNAGIEWKDFGAAIEGGDTNGVVASEKAGLLPHPHPLIVGHEHTHADGTTHAHDHHHGDSVVGHDSTMHHISHVASMAMSGGAKEVTNAHKTKPAEYKDVPDESFADRENYKYPIDSAHVKAAVGYFNHPGEREKGGYSESQWATIGGRIAAAAGEGHHYSGGKIVTKEDKEIADLEARLAELRTKAATKKPPADDEEEAGESADEEKSENEAAEAKKKKELPLGGANLATLHAKEIADLRAIVEGLKAELVQVKGAQAKSQAEIAEEFFTARVVPQVRGYQASESAGNVKDQLKGRDTETQDSGKNSDLAWFNDKVLGGMKG